MWLQSGQGFTHAMACGLRTSSAATKIAKIDTVVKQNNSAIGDKPNIVDPSVVHKGKEPRQAEPWRGSLVAGTG